MQRPKMPHAFSSGGSESYSSTLRRTSSMSSDRMSISTASSMASPPPVSPEPAFIAASAASQIVTSDHQSQMEVWFEEENGHAEANTAMVMPSALAHINSFLDQLLYGILATARSTSIAALRPAVSEVLKPRLARDAINGADEELQDFASGKEEEDMRTLNSGTDFNGMGDLNLIWRRTRLRCMVYTRLGDLEEEDEEAYIEREIQEDTANGRRRSSDDLFDHDLSLVSPPSAIFLTSILEFIGEQSLLVAGDAAYHRLHDRRAVAPESSGDRTIVEETDVEKIAFDTRLGRLWRSWKKRVRSPGIASPRIMSRESIRGWTASNTASNPTSRKASVSEFDDGDHRPDFITRRSVAQVMEEPQESIGTTLEPYDIPLPQSPVKEDRLFPVKTIRSEIDANRPKSMLEYSPNRPFDMRIKSYKEGEVAPRSYRQRSTSMPSYRRSSGPQSIDEEHKVVETPQNEATMSGEQQEIEDDDSDDTQRRHMVSSIHDHNISTMYDGVTSNEVHEGMGQQLTTRPKESRKAIPDNSVQASKHEDDEPARAFDDQSSDETETTQTDAEQISHKSTESDYELPVETYLVDHHNKQTNPHIQDNFIDIPQQKREWIEENGTYGQRSTLDHDEMQREHSIPEYEQPYIPAAPSHLAQREAASQANKRVDKPHAQPYHTHVQSEHDDHAIHETSTAPQRSDLDISDDEDHARLVSKPSVSGNEIRNGAPPLTPLRELLDAANDTSDEASSLAPSQGTPKADHHAFEHMSGSNQPPTGAASLPIFSNAKPASNFSDLKKQLPPVATGVERATVQRIAPSPLSAHEPITPLDRMSTSSNRELKNIVTSSSSISHKARSSTGRISGDTARRATVTRHSSESSEGLSSEKRSVTVSRSGDPQLDFDQLIKSDETVKFTLTPQNMRDMESGSPRHQPHKRTDTQDLADFIRNSGPEGAEAGRPSTSRSIISGKGFSGLKANVVNTSKRVASGPTSAESPKTKSGRYARGARNEGESTRDFADFLRSTGPEITPPQKQAATGVAGKKTVGSPTTKLVPEQLPSKKITKPPPSSVAKRANSQTKKTGLRLQAREPTTQKETTYDLAEFIRQGPVGDRGDERRLRSTATGATLAPSSSKRLVNGSPRDAIMSTASTESNQNSSVFAQSVNSINSRTALLDSPRSNNHQYSGQNARSARQPARGDQPPQPLRKQRRVKDPYAIDTESEQESEADGEEDLALDTGPESLVDMFQSLDGPGSSIHQIPSAFSDIPKPPTKGPEPPSKLQYPTIHDRTSAARKSPPNLVNRQASTNKAATTGIPSISTERGMTTRNPGPHQQPPIQNSQPSPRSRGPPNHHTPQPAPRVTVEGYQPRATSPHLIPSPFTSKLDQYRPTTATYASHMDAKKRISPRSEQQGSQGYFRNSNSRTARAEREEEGGTSELADFLKNSGPPEQAGRMVGWGEAGAGVVEARKEKGGFSRFLGRRKKN